MRCVVEIQRKSTGRAALEPGGRWRWMQGAAARDGESEPEDAWDHTAPSRGSSCRLRGVVFMY